MAKTPRNVHVLFLHGVGRHPRLSALLRAYQGFRSDLLGTEAPVASDDQIKDWWLEEFSDDPSTPFVKLSPTKSGPKRLKDSGPQRPEAVYLHEVNYSSLSGVIRENQPLDITRLFVGMDLAVNVARQRELASEKKTPRKSELPKDDRFQPNQLELARTVQKLTGVLVACSVPILGLPARLLRNYTDTFVTEFSRFFEDVATLALDNSAQELIQRHVERTIENFLQVAKFQPNRDEFVIAAHSLGSIVAHIYLLSPRTKDVEPHCLPDRLLTYGSPIGLIGWMWLFLDYPGFKFDLERSTEGNYFCWDPSPGVPESRQKVLWINVVNHLDPIASAFPQNYADFSLPPGKPLSVLQGGKVHHRYIKTGGMFSAGFAHTAYITKSPDFKDILGRMAHLHTGKPLQPAAPTTASIREHWKRTIRNLMQLRVLSWCLGLLAIGGYLTWIAGLYNEPGVVLLLPLYAWPPATIAALAFFQRLVYGRPTKRTSVKKVLGLTWMDLASFPYWLRYRIGLGHKPPNEMPARPGRVRELLTSLLAFTPTILAMAAPFLLAREWSDTGPGLIALVTGYFLTLVALVCLFFLYLVLFAVSEFVTHWRAVTVELTRQRFPERDPAIGIGSWPIYALLVWSLLALGVWGLARLGLCWGDHGWVGAIICRAHWGTLALLVGAGVVFWLLLFNLARDTLKKEPDQSESPRFRRTRAAWRGYRKLKGADFAQATLSPVLVILLLIAFLWLLVFSAVRF